MWDNPDIWFMEANGANVTQLTTNPANDWGPHWGADGLIYFASNRGALV